MEGEEGEDDEMSGVSRQSLGGLEEALEQYSLSTPPPERGPGRLEREEEGRRLGGGGAGVDGVGGAAGLVRVLAGVLRPLLVPPPRQEAEPSRLCCTLS